jgi:hypothetical protein
MRNRTNSPAIAGWALGLALALVVGAALPAWSAGSCTAKIESKGQGAYRDITFRWTSDAFGNVSGACSVLVYGLLDSVYFESDADAPPTDLYDVQVLSAGGENLLDNGVTDYGANVPSNNASPLRRRLVLSSSHNYIRIFDEYLSISISGAGDTKKGVVKLRVW